MSLCASCGGCNPFKKQEGEDGVDVHENGIQKQLELRPNLVYDVIGEALFFPTRRPDKFVEL